MKGQLQDMAVADIIQHNCQDRKTARVSLKMGGKRAQLFFKNGNVVHASSGKQEGEEVIYEVINWDKGSFDLKTDVEPPAYTITRGWTSLLLEGAKRHDEALEGKDQDNSLSPLLATVSENGGPARSPHLATRVNLTKEEPIQDGLDAESENPEERSTQALLADLATQTDGFIMAALATLKTDEVYTHSNWDFDVSPLIDQVKQFVKMVHVAVTKLDHGALEDDLLTTEDAFVLVRFLENDDYFLIITADKQMANLGNLRMLSRSYANWFGKTLESSLG